MEFELIFDHEDEDDDRLSVRRCLDYTIFRSERDGGEEVEVRLRHDRVAALHAALGEWLELKDPMQSSVVENSLIDQLIVRRVSEEVARVLPLHQAPQADTELRCDYDCSGCHQDDDGDDRVPEEPKYEDARPRRQPDPFAQFVASVKAAQDVVARAFSVTGTATGTGAGTWGTDGTSPNGPVPLCQARGCGHEYAQHIEYADSRPGYKQCTECPCVRYRSQA